MARLYGLHVTAPLTFRVDRLELIAEGMQRLRAQPPTTLAGAEVEGVVDLSKGWWVSPVGGTHQSYPLPCDATVWDLLFHYRSLYFHLCVVDSRQTNEAGRIKM